MPKTILELNNVGHWFEETTYLFKQMNLSLQEGETLAILGPNGQGKSTLISAIVGSLKLKEGYVKAPKKIAFVPQDFQVSLDFSVLDIVLMGRSRDISFFSAPSKEDERKALEALSMLEIEHLANRSFNQLSGGQRQLVLLSRAIASWSDLIILDEPASALDLSNQDRILDVIAMLKQKYNLSVVFTTHQPNHAIAVADKTLMMMSDLSFEIGSNKEVLTKENLTKLYGINVELLDFDWNGNIVQSATPIFSRQLT